MRCWCVAALPPSGHTDTQDLSSNAPFKVAHIASIWRNNRTMRQKVFGIGFTPIYLENLKYRSAATIIVIYQNALTSLLLGKSL